MKADVLEIRRIGVGDKAYEISVSIDNGTPQPIVLDEKMGAIVQGALRAGRNHIRAQFKRVLEVER